MRGHCTRRARRLGGLAPALLLVAAAPPPDEAAVAIEHDSLVVTGKRLGATRVDYALDQKGVAFCRRRDSEQDAAAVDRICGFVRDCVFEGQRAPVALRVCVEVRVVRWERRQDG